MRRRTLIKSALVGGAAAASGLGTGLASGSGAVAAGPLSEWKYRLLVPELFRALPDPPSHSEVLVIGSGFGGSVAALRLAQAGLRVSVLERGSRWPTDRWREIQTGDALPDGRGFWRRDRFTGVTGLPQFFDSFGGVLDATDFAGVQVWRGAAVGGGSVVYTGAQVVPERRFFDRVFSGLVDYDEMTSRWYPLAQRTIGGSPMPEDVYASAAFTHSRTWDRQALAAGYQPQRISGGWDWERLRDETRLRARPSATIGESNLGNGNGVKLRLTDTYLREAEATGRASVFAGHEVQSLGRAGNRFQLVVTKVDPMGRVLVTRTLTADRVVLAAGSVGSSALLVKARALGTLPALDPSVGDGWGTNGDAAVVRAVALEQVGRTQGVPSASRIVDESGDLPVSLENWFVPGLPLDVGLVASLGMTLDPTRGRFAYDTGRRQVTLSWRTADSQRSAAALRVVNDRIARASGTTGGVPGIAADVNTSFTAHPLGGAVLGRTLDGYGRVRGYPGLYVFDGAAVPGSTGNANPSLTITALAERNVAAVVAAGG